MKHHNLANIICIKHQRSFLLTIFLFLIVVIGFPAVSVSQDGDPVPPVDYDSNTVYKNTTVEDSTFANVIAGEFTPGKGFDIVKTSFGSLNISAYGLVRWIDQLPNEDTYTDHLGRSRPVKGRNDIYFQRSLIWITGFIGVPRFRYNLTIWGLGTTQQTLLFGSIQYIVGPGLRIGAGVNPNLGIRSLQGSFPYWNGSDRQMGEEALRPGFTMSVFAYGEMLPRLYYGAALGDNLSILGATANALTRDLAPSASLFWMPTTGEFGPRGGHGDLEHHNKLATRFGVSFNHFRDSKQSSDNDSLSGNTQVKTSDGIPLYERGALADGVTVLNSNFDMGSVDIGFKYRGFFFQVQYFYRNLSKFKTIGTLPDNFPGSIMDQMIQVDLSHMVIHRTLNAYVSGSYMFDEFKNNPYEICAGLNYYPIHTRNWRLNAHFIYITKSPASSTFGYYVAGQTGPTLSLCSDFLF